MARIVCVEDEEMIREDLVQELLDAGHEVRSADNGKAGLELIRSFPPDLILSDCLMPVMTGEELLRVVRRSSDRLRRVPFVFLSANARPPAVEDEDPNAGATVYLTKPVDFDQLVETIDGLLGRDACRRF